MPALDERKLSAVQLTRRIVREVWEHPNNRGNRPAAVLRSMAWQLRKRLGLPQSKRTVFGNMKIWMNPAFGSTSNIVYFGDRFDLDEMQLIERFVRPGDHVLDVGANVGTYTLLLSALVGPSGKVESFEPVPKLADELERNITLNDLGHVVTVHRSAVTDDTGEIRFRADRDVSSRIASESDPDAKTLVVPCGRLDDLVADGSVSLIKLDVEGAEAGALRGFRQHLDRGNPPLVILELFSNQLARQGATVGEVTSILAQSGYELAQYSAATGKLSRPPASGLRGNVIALRSDRSEWIYERLATA